MTQPGDRVFGVYRALFEGPGARRLAFASALGWLGFGALALAIVLAVQRASGSPSTAGLALAAFSVGSALAPLRGRLVDRFGVRVALVPMAAASGACLIALAAVARDGAPGGALVALAGLAGVTVPPLIASARVVWPVVVAPEHLQPAYGIQALLGDLGGVAGPALAGALVVTLAPLAATRSAAAAALVLAFAGVAFAAANVAVYELLDVVAPAGTGAEALTWLTTAGGAGSAIGAVVAGRLAAAGSLTTALAVPCAAVALAAVVVSARRATLTNGGH
jgi:MFS family permease